MSQTEVAPDRRSAPGTPRWVKVFGIIALVLVLVFITLHLTGRSPMDHNSNMSNMDMSPTQQGAQQP
jgi:hypothetical protein